MNKYCNFTKCTKESCDLCRTINAEPIDIEKHGAKLVTVRIKINNVCIGKKVAIASIIYDECNRILAFKGFVTMAAPESSCKDEVCGTIEKTVVFVIPDTHDCEVNKLRVKTIGNYIYPCE